MIKWFRPAQLEIADVLATYLSDAHSSDMTHEGWCSEFGYDPDSIKSLNIYLACQKIRDGLIKLFGYKLFNDLTTLEH